MWLIFASTILVGLLMVVAALAATQNDERGDRE